MLATGGAEELSNRKINFQDINSLGNYYTKSRYIPFQKCCECIKQYLDINTCLDLCTSYGHFVYVALENNINCEGLI